MVATIRNEPRANPAIEAISRIVVTFAGAAGGGPLVEAAALIARALRAELHGVYIRDQALRDLAGLSVSAVVGPGGAKAGGPTIEAVERAWRREERSCRRVLEQAGGRKARTFDTVAGEFEHCVCTVATRRDVVALAGQPAQMTPHHLAAAVRAAVRSATAVMVVGTAPQGRLPGPRAQAAGPILAIEDRDSLAGGVRALAARLAEAAGRRLAILRVLGSRAPPDASCDLAPEENRHVDRYELPFWSESGLAAAVDRIGPSLVVADLESPGLSEAALAERFIRSIRAPLILLGAEGDRDAD